MKKALLALSFLHLPALAQLPTVPENTWVRLNPVLNGGIIEARSYSGMVYNPDAAALYYFGGAHGSYLGNDVDEFDVTANVWRQHYAPEYDVSACAKTYGGDCSVSPLGRPQTAHTYHAFDYSTAEKAFVYFPWSTGTWLYYPASKTWVKRTKPPISESDPLGRMAVYVKEQDLFYVLFTNGQFWTYYLPTDKWTQKSQPPVSGIYAGNLVYVPDAQRIFFFKSQTASYQLSNGQWTLLGSSPVGGNAGAAYDSRNRVIVGWSSGGGLYKLDPMSAQPSWIALSPSGPTPSSGGSIHYEFAYDPVNNVFIALAPVTNYIRPGGDQSGAAMHTWAYRYKANAGSRFESGILKDETGLDAAPNPFKTFTRLSWSGRGAARMAVFDVRGKEIFHHLMPSGEEVRWMAGNRSAGVYLVRMEAAGRHFEKRLFLTK